MTSTTTRPDLTPKVRTRGRRVKPRGGRPPVVRAVIAAAVIVLLVLGIWLAWLASGLLSAARSIQDKAAVAQQELTLFRDALKTGDEDGAKTHLAAGKQALADAQDAAGQSQVRIAAGLPYVGSTVDDLDHLLAAAAIMTGSADDALTVYQNFSGADSELFKNGRFSIPAITEAQQSVAAIRHSMDDATAELRQVHGSGPKGDTVLEKKRSGLEQISNLRKEIVALGPLLDAMPSAVGAKGTKTYLVAIMNQAEMRASGGAPLSVAFVRFKNGRMAVPQKGATSFLTNLNAEYYWNRLSGKKDPFALPAGEAERFVNTTFNPDFGVSGEQMVRATQANFGFTTDGVIALDVNALAHLLDVTGPIESTSYGKLTSKNLSKKLVVQAYRSGSDAASVRARHDVNDQLMTVMLSRLTEGGGLIGKAQALGAAVPGRHLQMYFRDDRLQDLVVDKHLGGLIPTPRVGNLSAVFTQNGNGNKMDVFQQRTVREQVRLRADGSAKVTRTVAIENPTPPYIASFPDRHRGYDTRWATNLVINLMPPGAKVTKSPQVALTSTVADGVDQGGRTYAKAAVVLPPDGSAAVTWEYVVPHAAVVKGDTMHFRDIVVTQSMQRTPTLEITVVAPTGWTAKGGDRWKSTEHGARTQVPMDRQRVLRLSLTR